MKGKAWLTGMVMLGMMGLGGDIPIAAKTPTLIVQAESSKTSETITIEGTLDENSEKLEDGSYVNIHAFEGKEGENLTIEVKSDDFNPILGLFNLEREIIGVDRNNDNRNNAKITGTFPKTGTYVIMIIAKQAGETGNYRLSLQNAAETDIALAEAERLNQQVIQLYQQGRYNEAIPLAEQALAIRKRVLGDNHPNTAQSLNNLAGLYWSQGRYTEAEPLYLQGLEIEKEQLGDNHPDTATSLNNLAGLYQSQDNIPLAINYLQQALEIEEYNLSENLNIGDEKQKRDYIRTVRGTTDWVISLNLQAAPNNPQATELALKTILERKGRILDVLTNRLLILRQRTDDPESQQLLSELEAIQTQQANLAFTPVDKFPSPEAYRQLLTDVQTKSRELEDKISRRSAEFRNLSQPITLEAIQQQIPRNSALVEIVRYQPFNPKASRDESFGEPHYAAYILFPNGEIKTKDLGEAAPIEENLELYRTDLLDKGKPSIEQVKESARELDEQLMQPIRELLGETKTIYLSPDAALNLIPFEALVMENNQYLVKEYTITYLTSGRDLLRLKDKFPSETAPLIMANPSYEKEGEQIALNPDNTRSLELSEYLENTFFPPLPETQPEAEALKEMFPQSIILTEQEATENALKQVKRPDILHIATHGFFRESPPQDNNNPTQNYNPLLRSGLVFAGVKVEKDVEKIKDDGVLTALETTYLNLVGTQLVVLSACETGQGDITTGEGVYGLRRALVIAGSESQLFSLWRVDDAATKDLMVNYYQRLKDGEGRTAALRNLQLEMINKNDTYSHPYYWASFVPSGETAPMKF